MTTFTGTLVLALAWMVLTGSFTPSNFVVGLVFSYLVLRFVQHVMPHPFVDKIPKVIGFAAFYLWELLKANLRVAHDVLTPQHYMRPGVIAFPLDVTTDAEITILANLISMTPGTLSLDVSTDRRCLYIHAMYIDDEAELLEQLKDMERRVMEILR